MNIEKIKEIMEDKGIRAKDIVAATGLPKTTISSIMTGATPDPRISTVKKMAKTLGVTIDEIA